MTDTLRTATLLLGLCVVLMVFGNVVTPGFLSFSQIGTQLQISAFLGLFALCQTFVLIVGGEGIDLSVGATGSLGGIVGAALLHGQDATVLPVAILMALAGGAVGAVNGLGIALFGVPPLVMTLAVASIVNGGLIIFESAVQPAIAASPFLVQLAGRATLGVPNIFLLWIVVGLAAVWFLSATSWGRKVIGTGANPQVALLSGTHVMLVKILVYALSGLVAALSGFCLIGYVGAAFLGLGDAYVLSSIVVAVIGGTSLAGGRGSYVGVAAAAILITVLTSLLTTMQIGEAGRQIVFGCILIGFLLLNRRLDRQR
ncbi:MAG TPA: ABC transporter permease [Xanthobacteraceae bacterium]|nr:ABC transporter permease [Xanthobacteraceae bacterium]